MRSDGFLVVVLSQDCDLTWDFNNDGNDDKKLLSILVAPLYNVEHVYLGEHLSDLDLKMRNITSKKDSTENKNLKQNQTPRYHYIEFPEEVEIVNSVIDFKHYFTINRNYFYEIKDQNFVCRLAELYREDLSFRFANYLSRIGLPD